MSTTWPGVHGLSEVGEENWDAPHRCATERVIYKSRAEILWYYHLAFMIEVDLLEAATANRQTRYNKRKDAFTLSVIHKLLAVKKSQVDFSIYWYERHLNLETGELCL